MANQVAGNEEILGYVRRISLRDDEILRELRAETRQPHVVVI